jgi:hypothetical protein
MKWEKKVVDETASLRKFRGNGNIPFITTHEVNDGEELISIEYFSSHFNFPEKKRRSGMPGKYVTPAPSISYRRQA